MTTVKYLVRFFGSGMRLFIGVLCFIGVAGCATLPNPGDAAWDDLPPSNREVGERAIERALAQSGIPDGSGATVGVRIAAGNRAQSLLETVSLEFLQKKGYRVSRKDGAVPNFRFTLDTLFVNIEVLKNEERTKIVSRHSEARIGTVFQDSTGNREIYRGRGTHVDSFPAVLLGTVTNEDAFVHVSSVHDRVIRRVRPFFIGVTMTALVWWFYSFRG